MFFFFFFPSGRSGSCAVGTVSIRGKEERHKLNRRAGSCPDSRFSKGRFGGGGHPDAGSARREPLGVLVRDTVGGALLFRRTPSPDSAHFCSFAHG